MCLKMAWSHRLVRSAKHTPLGRKTGWFCGNPVCRKSSLRVHPRTRIPARSVVMMWRRWIRSPTTSSRGGIEHPCFWLARKPRRRIWGAKDIPLPLERRVRSNALFFLSRIDTMCSPWGLWMPYGTGLARVCPSQRGAGAVSRWRLFRPG